MRFTELLVNSLYKVLTSFIFSLKVGLETQVSANFFFTFADTLLQLIK